ncbi:MAG: DUF2513 domain-containing protein [Coriobacteriia bacterium]|nr:DUF2513 domain-containing protein [Coriobacteriia bacterium]
MKRDMDLVRDMLKAIEDADGPLSLRDFELSGHTQESVYYHLRLLYDKGMIEGVLAEDDIGELRKARVDGLTWDGQDFLYAIADKKVWDKVKDAVAKSVGSASFEVIKQVAEVLIVSTIKAHMPGI